MLQEVLIMDDKCSKYEGLFIFSDENTLNQHLMECEDCKNEHEKMLKVSELISEVKPYYTAKKSKLRKLRAVAAFLFIMFFSATFGVLYTDNDIADSLMYGNSLTAEDLGFPVDSYGFLMVD